MSSYFFLLCLISITFQQVLSICEIATKQTDCGHLSGCKWNVTSNTCEGVFQCQFSYVCYIINPNAYNLSISSQTNSSTVQHAQSIESIIQEATDFRIRIYILTKFDENVTVNIPNPIIQDVRGVYKIVLSPIFPQTYYRLNISQALEVLQKNTTIPETRKCVIEMLYQLVIESAIFIWQRHGGSFLCSEPQRLGLVIEKSIIENQGSADNPLTLMRSSGGLAFFTENKVINSSVNFVLKDVHMGNFWNCELRNLVIRYNLIYSYGSNHFYFTSNNVTNITSMYSNSTLVHTQALGQTGKEKKFGFYYFNLFENINCQILNTNLYQMFTLYLNNFQNINFIAPSDSGLIALKGFGEKACNFQLIKNKFTNITVRHTIIFSTSSKLQVSELYFTNIKRIRLLPHELDSADSPFLARDSGVCIYIDQLGFLQSINSHFRNIDSNCILARDSQIQIQGCSFNNSELISQKNDTYWQQYQGQEKFPGVTWVTIEGTKTRAGLSGITSCSFGPNGGFPQYGGALKITSTSFVFIEIENSSFSGLKAMKGGAIYSSIALGSIVFKSGTIENSIAQQDGGAAYFQTASPSKGKASYKVKFNNLKIQNNIALRNGGGIFIDWANFFFNNVDFIYNTAFNGGGLYMVDIVSNPYSGTQTNKLRSTSFKNNTAKAQGPAIKLFFDFVPQIFYNQSALTTENNTFINGQSLDPSEKSQVCFHNPSYYLIKLYRVKTVQQIANYSLAINDTSITELSESFFHDQIPQNFTLQVRSGHSLPFIMQILVLDQNKKLLKSVFNEEISFILFPNQNSTLRGRLISFPMRINAGEVIFQNELIFSGPTNSTAQLVIKVNSEKSNLLLYSKAPMTFNFSILFKPCEIGDIYNSKSQDCVTCNPGTFSLVDPYQENAVCQTCIPEATCLGGSIMPPKPGYYRFDTSTAIYQSCSIPDSCLGGYIDDKFYYPNGKCKEPFSGQQCLICDQGHAKFGGIGNCYSCKSSVLYYLKFLLLLMIQMFALFLTICINNIRKGRIKRALDSKDKTRIKQVRRTGFNAVRVKMAINYCLMMGIISQYGFKWPEQINSIFSSLTNALPTAEQGFSTDCFIVLLTDSNNRSIYAARLVLIILKPILTLLLFSGIYICINQKRLVLRASFKGIQEYLILASLATFYIMQTEVITSCLNLFKCKNLSNRENPRYFMEQDPEIECYEGEHFYWAFFFALPIFLILDLAIPIILFLKMKAVANDPYKQLRYLFFFVGLKDEYYFWEFLNLIRKDLLIFIGVFLVEQAQPGGQALLSFFVLILFAVLQYSKKPYVDKRLNLLEEISLASQILMLITSMLHQFRGASDTNFLKGAFTLFSIVSNCAFFIVLAIFTVQEYRSRAILIAREVKKKLTKTNNRNNLNTKSNETEIKESEEIPISAKNQIIMEDFSPGIKNSNSQYPSFDNSPKRFVGQSEEMVITSNNTTQKIYLPELSQLSSIQSKSEVEMLSDGQLIRLSSTIESPTVKITPQGSAEQSFNTNQ